MRVHVYLLMYVIMDNLIGIDTNVDVYLCVYICVLMHPTVYDKTRRDEVVHPSIAGQAG